MRDGLSDYTRPFPLQAGIIQKLLVALQQGGNSHTAPDAQGNNALPRLHCRDLLRQMHAQPRSTRGQRMTNGNGSPGAVHA